MKIKFKPLSVNRVWQGRRFKTKEYKNYEEALLYQLPKAINIPDGKIKMKIIFGFSSKMSDIDNPVKPLLDILQKKYDFNDKRIYELEIIKKDVKKEQEFIGFNFYAL